MSDDPEPKPAGLIIDFKPQRGKMQHVIEQQR